MTELFCMDNLELMKELPDDFVDLIYCDILYATGRDFGDYQDLKPIRSEIEDHYIPRIKEMHRILKPTGSIVLQMDTRINHWLRCILDDIFGYKNFRNEISWIKGNSMNTKTNYFLKNSDRILLYSKSKNFTFNIQYRPISEESVKRYNLNDNGRMYMQTHILKRGYNANRTLIFNDKEYEGEYAWTQETLDSKINSGVIVEVGNTGTLVYRAYLDENKGVQLSDIWADIPVGSGQQKDYQTQKPEVLLERIIKASSNEGDVVADFYLGSGTTAVVSKRLNRHFVGCDINPKAIEITEKRLNNESINCM